MKKHFLTGLVVLMPVALTLVIILFLIDLFTAPFIPIVSAVLNALEASLNFHIPKTLTVLVARISALILLFLFILGLGAVARWFFFKNILEWGGQMLSRIPIFKTVYKASRDIFHALFSSEGKKAFKHPVMIPYSCHPSYALGFEAGEVAEEIQEKIKTPVKSVFMPTAPHPISGFLFFMPEQDVHKVAMTNEESVKFLLSCGMIGPQRPQK